MLGSQALNLLKQRLRRSTGTDASFDTWATDELSAAQDRLELGDVLPWFLISERSYEEIVINEERVLVPSDFIREIESEVMQVEDTSDGSYTEIVKTDYESLKSRFADEETGKPKKYDLVGEYFRLRPIPDKSTYRLWMAYYAKDAAFSVGAENQWLKWAPDLLIAEAGIVIASTINNQPSVQLFRGLLQTELNRLHRANVARDATNKPANPED